MITHLNVIIDELNAEISNGTLNLDSLIWIQRIAEPIDGYRVIMQWFREYKQSNTEIKHEQKTVNEVLSECKNLNDFYYNSIMERFR